MSTTIGLIINNKHKQLTTNTNNWFKHKQLNTSCNETTLNTDSLIRATNDLLNPQFHAWYCKKFYELGVEEVLKLASIARSDARYDKRKLFSHLLKNRLAVVV